MLAQPLDPSIVLLLGCCLRVFILVEFGTAPVRLLLLSLAVLRHRVLRCCQNGASIASLDGRLCISG